MKVLLLSTYDIHGGAAKAAYRLKDALYSFGLDSHMFVQVKYSDDLNVQAVSSVITQKFPKLRPHIDSLPKLLSQVFYTRTRNSFSLQWLPSTINDKISHFNPDIINLHWVSGGFLNVETIAKLEKPIVWTLHDMWAFTGGCHYSQGCKAYQTQCGNCPQMPPQYNIDLSNWVWHRKAKAWQNLNLTIVTPSKWLANCVKASSLLGDKRIEVIPYSIDIHKYQPINRQWARIYFNLPQDKYLILFGAENPTSTPRKGFHLLKQALFNLSQTEWKNHCELVVFGAAQADSISNLGLKVNYVGRLIDEASLAKLYSSCDVFVAPSLEDNLPNTVMESLACGTPCVAFNIGGIPDMIEHYKNGYIAKPFEVEDLVRGIIWTLENVNLESSQLRCFARQKAEAEFNMGLQASRYSSLFEEIHKKFTNIHSVKNA